MSDPKIQSLPGECLEPRVWKSTCPLIFYAIVEGHYPERVLCQFGLRQGIPREHEFNNFYLHGIDRKAGQILIITIGCDHRLHNIDGLNSLVDQHRSIDTNVHRIATLRQSTNILNNDQTERPEVGKRRTTRRRTHRMRSCDSEDGVGPSTSNLRPTFTGHTSSSYPDHMFSVSAPESYCHAYFTCLVLKSPKPSNNPIK